jgi:hypothetical protein
MASEANLEHEVKLQGDLRSVRKIIFERQDVVGLQFKSFVLPSHGVFRHPNGVLW